MAADGVENLISWMRFYLALGAAQVSSELIRRYGSAASVYAHLQEIADGGLLDGAQLAALRQSDEARAAEILAVCREFNWQVLTAEDPRYPAALRALRDFPVLLFAAGELQLLQNPLKAAVVGTRGASDGALGVAYGIGAELSYHGAATVSGCARGVDSAAGEGALAYGGSTVGVLGCGVGYNYMPEKVFFRRRIIKRGLLLTELPPFSPPTKYSFPRRNRIIAGLSSAVIVVQSGRTGGSLITAADAFRQGKPVFVPDEGTLPSEGCIALTQKGARPIADLSPVYECFRALRPEAQFRALALSGYRDAPPAALFPSRMTLEDFAFYSGVTPAEAKIVYERYYAAPEKGTAAEKPQPLRVPEQLRMDLRAKPKKEPAAPKPRAAAPPRREAPEKQAAPALSGPEKTIFDALGGDACTLDSLADRTGLDIRTVMKTATLLELRGLIGTLPGNTVKRK